MTLAVPDSGPIIALAQIGTLNLLPALFTTIHAPPAVRREVQSVPFPEWIVVQPLREPLDPRVPRSGLDAGEREVIALALERAPDAVVLDDLEARRVAARLRLPVIGTLGLLVVAKRRGIVAEVRPLLDRLRAARFFAAEHVYQQVLREAGEG